MDQDLSGASRAPVRAALPTGTRALVFAAAVLAQVWVLALPFQFDDYAALQDPLAIFGAAPAHTLSGAAPSEMRLALWLLWSVCHALAGTPLSPLPFHISGLLLHGAVSVLLARLVARIAPPALAARSGLLAGLAFGLSAGGIQAVSWTAAQGDVLFPLFALLAAHTFLDARERVGPRATRAHILAVLWTVVALVSKTPAFLVPPALFALLVAARPRALRRDPAARVWTVELALLALATALGFAARYFYLGSFALRYGHLSLPDFDRLAALLPRALGALGQALYPWNKDALFEGDGPLLAELVLAPLDASPPLVALALFGALLAAAAFVARSARGALVAAFALAVLCTAPAALLYSHQATNVVSRTTYFPLLAAWTAVAIACAGLLARARRTGIACTALVLLVVLDTTVHVARTELLAAGQQSHARAEIARVVGEHAALGTGRALVLLAVVPSGGVGGIPCLGFRVVEACRPPFAAAPGLDVRAFATFDEALEHLASDSFAERDLALVVELAPGERAAEEGRIALDEELGRGHASEPGAARRALARMRRSGGIRTGVAAASLAPSVAWTRADARSSRWSVAPPLPAHALCAVELVFDPGGAEQGELVIAREDGQSSAIPLELGASERARRVPLETWLTLEDALGPRVVAVDWTGRAALAARPVTLAHVPALELLRPAPDAPIELGPDPPRFRFALPAVGNLPSAVRLELRELLPQAGPRPFFGDGQAAPSNGALEFVLTATHLRREHSPAAGTPPDAAPWSEAQRILAADLRHRPAYRGEMDWRASLHHPGGHLAARSSFRRGRFVPPGAAGTP